MPKSLAAFIQEQATKAGIDATDQKLKDIITNTVVDLTKIEIPDDLLVKFESNLHSLESAKAKLRPTMWAEALNGVDVELYRTMDELGLDDATKAELKAHKSGKMASELAKKIQALEAAKVNAKAGDKKELTDEINRLKQEKADLSKAKTDELAATKDSYEAQITELAYDNMISGYNLAIPQGLTKEDIMLIAKTKLKTAMQADELRIVRQNGQLTLVDKNGTEYFDKSNNQKKDLKSFTESSLAQHKLLKTNDPNPSNPGNPAPAIIPGTPTIKASDAEFLKGLDAQIAEMTKA